jgi:hypothetical protein
MPAAVTVSTSAVLARQVLSFQFERKIDPAEQNA